VDNLHTKRLGHWLSPCISRCMMSLPSGNPKIVQFSSPHTYTVICYNTVGYCSTSHIYCNRCYSPAFSSPLERIRTLECEVLCTRLTISQTFCVYMYVYRKYFNSWFQLQQHYTDMTDAAWYLHLLYLLVCWLMGEFFFEIETYSFHLLAHIFTKFGQDKLMVH
jgi:hypothetical protein